MKVDHQLLRNLTPFITGVLLYFIAWLPVDQPSLSHAVLKCLPILALIDFVHDQNINPGRVLYQQGVQLGLTFSCIGDALLIWDHHFVPGMIAFALAHICYIKAIGFKRPVDWFKGAVFLVLSTAAMFLFYPGLRGILVPAVFIYNAIICTMGWSACATIDKEMSRSQLYARIGSLLFIASDLVIGVDKFVLLVPRARFVIMSTYYMSQCLIALSVLDSPTLMVE